MMFRRLIVFTLCIAMILSCAIVAGAESNDEKTFVTSDNISFSLDEFDIYMEDFEDVEFKTSQEVIDYIYKVGKTRQKTRDAQYEILGQKLTEDEIALLVEYPEFINPAKECSEKAIAKAREVYPNQNGDGRIGNAFQHAYWVILMYYYTSPSFSIAFALAHENYDGNPELHSMMDRYNDYAAYNYCTSNIRPGTHYIDANLKSFASDMMQRGLLEYVIFDYEYVARIRYYEATGKTVEIKATGNFYAYTNTDIPHNVPAPVYEVVPALPGQPGLKP